MQKYCLMLNQVILPGPPGIWPSPLDLTLELNEILLIEKVGSSQSAPLLKVASSFHPPVAGQVWHWGLDAFSLAEEELYDLRRRIAYIAPGQVLLSRLTLGENIALGPCFHEGISSRAALAEHADLLEQLALQPYLALLPHEVEEEVYLRALWARELVKQPELILVALGKSWEPFMRIGQGFIFLHNYLAAQGVAALVLGQSLTNFHPLASRLLRLESARLIAHPLAEHQGRPLIDFLPLITEEEEL